MASDGDGEAQSGAVTIYTDGGCKGNPGPGGWGAVLMYSGRERDIWGGEPHTTNNRMELMAAIMALETLKRACRVDLYTDSQYVRNGITPGSAVGRPGAGGLRETIRSRTPIFGSASTRPGAGMR